MRPPLSRGIRVARQSIDTSIHVLGAGGAAIMAALLASAPAAGAPAGAGAAATIARQTIAGQTIAGQTIAGLGPSVAVPAPLISTPPSGQHGFPFGSSNLALASLGYVEQEFLLAGTARAFAANAALRTDGRWAAGPAPGKTAPYLTRVLVRRPANAANFNGTVIVEWLNVTSGFDLDPEWIYAHAELLRDGYAWVGVSAQYDGVAALKAWETGSAARYAALFHPGDSYSYDIFAQAGAALRGSAGEALPLLGPLTPAIVIGAGESQSALRLMTYANAIQKPTQIYDGLLIHSGVLGDELSQSTASHRGAAPPAGIPALPDVVPPVTSIVRTDLSQPVLFLNTETDVGALGAIYTVHGEADGAGFRLWELAGAAHMDAYAFAQGAPAYAKSGATLGVQCGALPIDASLSNSYGLRSAIVALDRWIRTKTPPSSEPRIASWGPVLGAFGLERDAYGNVRGGIRLPESAVPIATETGVRPAAGLANGAGCMLVGAEDAWGSTPHASSLFNGTTPALGALYPTHQAYVGAVAAAASATVRDGVLLAPDAAEIEATANAAPVP